MAIRHPATLKGFLREVLELSELMRSKIEERDMVLDAFYTIHLIIMFFNMNTCSIFFF